VSEPTFRPDRLVAAGEANYASGQRNGSTLPLDKLIAEQAKDDTYHVHSLSLDAFPSGADVVQVRRKLKLAATPHGTLTGAKVFKCKCEKCRAASAAYQRAYNRRHRTTRYVCACCGSDDVRRERLDV